MLNACEKVNRWTSGENMNGCSSEIASYWALSASYSSVGAFGTRPANMVLSSHAAYW